jgi:hypothetical protein
MKKTLLLLLLLNTASTGKGQTVSDQENTGTNNDRSLVDNLQTCLQTLVAGQSGFLTTVTADLETENCSASIVCSLLSGGPTGTELATASISPALYSPRSLQPISFSSPPAIVAGQSYTIRLSAQCISGPGYSVWWYKSVNNAYTNGRAYTQSGLVIQPEDSLNDFYFQTFVSIGSGMADQTATALQMYPVPATTEISLVLPAAELVLCAADGRVLCHMHHAGGTLVLPVATLPRGLYLLKAMTANGTMVRRFIK